MAGEIQCDFLTGQTLYSIIRNSIGQVWNTNSSAFENYNASNYAYYPINMAEQGSNGYYTGTFPALITSPGVYSAVTKKRGGASPAESDLTAGKGDIQWNGSTIYYGAAAPTSGQVSLLGKVRHRRAEEIRNFVIYMVSAADNVTPFTSGLISGAVSRDGQSFAVLQSGASGAIQEIGRGFYNVPYLTSGDMNGNTVALAFSAVGVSGGVSQQRTFTMYMQRSG